MNIKVEIDLKPEELRRLLGLPDVAGLQEDMISYVRTKMTQGVEGFDAATLLRGGSKAWQRLFTTAFTRMAEQAAEEEEMGTEEDQPADSSPSSTRGSRGGSATGKKKKRSD